ncbi:MAG: hypothetical protein LCH67_04185 [Bacteroidetes bacterium]|nr:hypothetical protein [Bacteroidota bacterium]
MTVKDLKKEIKLAIEDAPESVLEDILNFLKKSNKIPEGKIDLNKHLSQIMIEDNSLLQKLAK